MNPWSAYVRVSVAESNDAHLNTLQFANKHVPHLSFGLPYTVTLFTLKRERRSTCHQGFLSTVVRDTLLLSGFRAFKAGCDQTKCRCSTSSRCSFSSPSCQSVPQSVLCVATRVVGVGI